MKGGNAAKRSDPIETQTIAATAGNVITNLTPGTGKRWRILRGTINLTTDGTVANRVLVMRLTDGTNITEVIFYSAALAASGSRGFDFGEARVVQDAKFGDGDDYMGWEAIIIEGAGELRLQILSGVAGDSYEGFFEVEESSIS